MSYSSMQVGGYFPPIMRAEFAIEEVVGSVLTFLIHAVKPKENVFLAAERRDAEITARDDNRNEIAKLLAP